MANRPPLDPDSNTSQHESEPTLTSRRDLLLGAVSMVAATAVPASAANPSDAAAAIPPSPTAKAAWHAFEVSLADALAHLDEDEFLTISPKHSNRFVQFLDQGAHGIRRRRATSTSPAPNGCRAAHVGDSRLLGGTSRPAALTRGTAHHLRT